MQLIKNTAEATTNINSTHNYGIADMSIVMDILTRLYSNPIQTLVQEYICNGRDASREVDSVNPVHITAPSQFASEFIVRDYGPGLSPGRIEKVFVLYGASTKRDTNGQTGGFGIGAKSAWAYTDSFTVTSFYNGLKSVYVCHKSGGNGNMDKISEEKTNEPNGVEIRIPVNQYDIKKFTQAIRRAVFFWKNERPTSNLDLSYYDGEFSTFELTSSRDLPGYLGSYGVDSYVIIDGIPYPCHFLKDCGINKIDDKINTDMKLFFIDNGKVEIAPSREELIASDRSKASLKIIIDKEAVKLQKKIDELFKDCKTDMDKIGVYNTYEGTYKLNKVTGYTWERLTSWGSRSYTKYGWVNRQKFKDDAFFHCYIDNTKNKIEKKKYHGFSTTEPIYYIDNDDSALKINNRLRNSGQKSVLIANESSIKDFEHYKKQLHMLPISSLALPAKQKVKRTIDNTKIMLHGVNSWGQFKSIVETLSNINDVYYIEYSNRHKDKTLLRFIKQNGKECYAVNSSVAKKLEKTGRGQHANNFIKEYKITDQLINSVINGIENGSGLEWFISKGIAFEGYKTLTKPSKTISNIPDSIYQQVKKTKQYIKYVATVENNKAIRKKLPLLDNIHCYDINKTALQEYVNWKLGV